MDALLPLLLILSAVLVPLLPLFFGGFRWSPPLKTNDHGWTIPPKPDRAP